MPTTPSSPGPGGPGSGAAPEDGSAPGSGPAAGSGPVAGSGPAAGAGTGRGAGRTHSHDRRWRHLRRALVGVLTAVVVAELVVQREELARAVTALSDPSWGWVVAAVVVDVVSMLAFALMQRHLLQGAGVGVRRRDVVPLSFAAHSLSVTLPGGPVFSTAYNFRRMTALGASRAVASWVIAVSATLSSVGLVVVAAGAGVGAGASGELQHLLITAAVVLGLLLLARRLGSHPRWTSLGERVVGLLVERVARRDPERALARLRALLHQLGAVRISPGRWATAGGASVLNWLLDAACLALCCRAVGLDDLGVVHLLLAYTAGMAAASVPLVPGGLGVVDTALSIGLVAGGAGTGEALAAIVLYRIISLGMVGGAGWAVWGVEERRRRRAPAIAGAPTAGGPVVGGPVVGGSGTGETGTAGPGTAGSGTAGPGTGGSEG